MTEMHEGGCVCGATRYRTKGCPARVSLCSCSWCRKRTGSALGISVYFTDDNVEFVQASLGRYRLTSDAGRWIDQEFCTGCGSPLTWTLEFRPGYRGIAGGSFDDPAFWYTPDRYAFMRTKPDWLEIKGKLELFQAMPPSR